jgi:hypothetical protein
MAQTGFTPIQLYYSSTTTNVPLAADLTNGELAINITDGKLFYKDNTNAVQVIAWKTTPTSAGGTGLTSYTAGDTLYYASGTALSKLAIGATGYYLNSTGSAPQWSAPAAITKTDDTNVTLTLGGSASTALLNAASFTLGWTGTLATTRGGTGLSSFTANGIVYASSTSALATGSALTFDGTNFLTTGSATAGRFIPSFTPSNTWGIDFASSGSVPNLVTVANAATYDLGSGSGVVVLHSNTDGLAAIFLTYAGNVTKLGGDASIVAGVPILTQVGLYYSGGSGKYRVENQKVASQDIFITTIRTRTAS